MILLFGGTTEGRRAADVLEQAGTPYYYSTKTGQQDITLHHGIRLDGALDDEAMLDRVQRLGIRLIVDAAHPFALQLHQTISRVAHRASIGVVRYERIYPPRDADITWIDDYSQVPRDIRSLLCTTGVQSIHRLKPLEAEGITLYYRILHRQSSIDSAIRQGATPAQLCYYDEKELSFELSSLCPSGQRTVNCRLSTPEALLLKESGLTGGFADKVAEARRCGMRIIALRRPTLPVATMTVDGPHGLRRAVEQQLPEFFPLKSGLTTGTCATAAAVAHALHVLHGQSPAEVPVLLPDGETISVAVGYGDGYAYCIKSAGDDPDVTSGLEIRAMVEPASQFTVEGGDGVGRFTLPGFDYPPGQPAINRGPRQMLQRNLAALCPDAALRVTISIPGGADVARRTFNPRLGIEGGLSVIGVSGIVMPYSEEAFVQSIRRCMVVARASGTDRVVINSGAKSERYLRERYSQLPAQAFVQYGNHIGPTLSMADEMGFPHVTLGIMLGKAVKLAQGHLDTHSHRNTMDAPFVARLLAESGLDIDVSGITLARQLWTLIPPDHLTSFVNTVLTHCRSHCQPLLSHTRLSILLLDDDGHIFTDE